MLTDSDFIRVLLLLTTALGLTFAVERFLELINGLLKKLLYSELSPFSDDEPDSDLDLLAVELDAIARTIDRQAEALGARRVADRLGDDAGKETNDALSARAVAEMRDRLDALRQDRAKADVRRIDRLSGRLDALHAALRDPDAPLDDLEVQENYPEVHFVLDPIAPRDPVTTAQTFWIHAIGAYVGILLCYVSDFGLFRDLGVFGPVSPLSDAVLTGVLIGGGSQPIHVLLKFLAERKVVTTPSPADDGVAIAPAASQAVSVFPRPPHDPADCDPHFALLDIPYAGGVDRDTLDPARRRPANPDLIVYHHTALHSDTSFDDVVRTFTNRGWQTGYHCVVMHDGAINAFCRWDYTGNHAYGVNQRSLGIALNGNFHTFPGESGSNDRGQYGAVCPSDAQLFNAARVVALWCHLYGIDVAFGQTILPHSAVRATVCAGSNFPDRIFEQLVKSFYDEWTLPEAQHELARYRQKQFLFVR